MIAWPDYLFFFATFLLILIVGLFVGREEKTSKDYFLGGKTLPWWGVAGSLFGTNISANHLVGMLGIGFSVGFAQSHYEFGSIPALLLLAYIFLPIFRRKKIYTLSQFLQNRYGQTASYLYSIILLILIAIQLTAGLYIGARAFLPFVSQFSTRINYEQLVVFLALASTIYTWFGGLKSVVYTDVIQTVLILFSGILLAYLTLSRPEVGGIFGLWEKDRIASFADKRLDLYLSPDHPFLPWTGALTGLFLLHSFYWSTNQYVVQRTLGARTIKEARLGILVSGFLKLTVPFFSILAGVGAYHIWKHLGESHIIDPDEAFSRLVLLVVPAGYGLVGVILAGLLGAIFSSIDSMLHSASTLFTIDLYLPLRKKWEACHNRKTDQIPDSEVIGMGRWFLLFFSALTTLLALLVYDPHSKGNFFLELSAGSSHFTPGILIVFLLGIIWKDAHRTAAWLTILISPILSFSLPYLYKTYLNSSVLQEIFGKDFNFLHRVLIVSVFALVFQSLTSLLFARRIPKTNLKFLLEKFDKTNLIRISIIPFYILSMGFYTFLRFTDTLSTTASSLLVLLSTISIFAVFAWKKAKTSPKGKRTKAFLKNDRLLAGLLLGITFGFYFLFS